MSEKGMQVYQMIFKRVWKSMRQEFRKRFAMNALYLRPHQRFGAGKDFIMREDYLGTADQIAPVADPNTPSSVMQIQQAIAVKQDSMQTPGYDIEVVTRKFLRALKVEDIDQVYPGIGKAKTPPNPKLQIEQMKLQPKMAQIQAQVKKMQSEAALIPAKIHLLEAQAAQAVKEAGNVGVAERLKAFELAIDTVKSHGEMLNERIAALQGQGEGDDGEKKGSADGGGMAKLDAPSGNGGVPDNAGPQDQGNPGPMGGGGIPGGDGGADGGAEPDSSESGEDPETAPGS
jgi:hypothetical protein